MAPVKLLYGFGEEALKRVTKELMASPRFMGMLVTTMQRGFVVKGQVDRNIATLLALLNLPSRAEVRKVAHKLDVIHATLAQLNGKLDGALARKAPPRRRPPARRRRSTRGGPGGDAGPKP